MFAISRVLHGCRSRYFSPILSFGAVLPLLRNMSSVIRYLFCISLVFFFFSVLRTLGNVHCENATVWIIELLSIYTLEPASALFGVWWWDVRSFRIYTYKRTCHLAVWGVLLLWTCFQNFSFQGSHAEPFYPMLQTIRFIPFLLMHIAGRV